MGRGIGYKDVLSMIKVAHNNVEIQSGGMDIFFFFVCEKHSFLSFDGDRISSSGPQIFAKLSHMINSNPLFSLSVPSYAKNKGKIVAVC